MVAARSSLEVNKSIVHCEESVKSGWVKSPQSWVLGSQLNGSIGRARTELAFDLSCVLSLWVLGLSICLMLCCAVLVDEILVIQKEMKERER